jgi:hypothetical protein
LLFSRRKDTARNLSTTQPRSRPTHTPTFQPTRPLTKPATAATYPQPMEVDAVRSRLSPLTPEERKHRLDHRLCLYCGKPGHQVTECRARANRTSRPAVRATSTTPAKNSQPQAL